MKITVKTTINAPLEQVWQAYITPQDIVAWNAASEDWHTTQSRVDLRVGGSFYSRMEAKNGQFGFDFTGVYTAIMPRQLIEYRFGDRMAKIVFTETTAGVMVEINFDPEAMHSIEQQQKGWQAILDNFACYVARNRPGRLSV
jgi:uncharacterized protein YndB with AHSA1/START domain